ncbi:unnamed protein product [Dracunculus medinensis]|uniref:Protein Wnt n=1 Tax=Dracunculus medinensis TaxID=318479 RepID=A0A0N4UBA1_DRAME|nr:unnamed protein product [Dracunculus medinensis]
MDRNNNGVPFMRKSEPETMYLQLRVAEEKNNGSKFAYFLALSTASAVRSIAHACARGRLRSCACDPSKIGPIDSNRSLVWASCNIDRGSDNLRYARRLSKRLIDQQFTCSDNNRALQIYLHNIAVGRSRVSLQIKCQCISAFGSCKSQRCEARATPIALIGNAIIESLSKTRRIRRSNTVYKSHAICPPKRNERHMRNRCIINYYRPVPLWLADSRGWKLAQIGIKLKAMRALGKF